MADETGISWCHRTFNPWTGCQKISPGCKFCYVERDLRRYKPGEVFFGPDTTREFRAEQYWKSPLKWNLEAEAARAPQLVFCLSQGDWLEDRQDLVAPRRRTCELIERTPWLTWLLLSKRPESWNARMEECGFGHWIKDPLPNVWPGTSIENQSVIKRATHLQKIAARARFISAEPLIGPLDLSGHLQGIDWVIAGGESGSTRVRPMHPDWARKVRDDCDAAGEVFHFKQWGAYSMGYRAARQHSVVWPNGVSSEPSPATIEAIEQGRLDPATFWPTDENAVLQHWNPVAVHGELDGQSHKAWPPVWEPEAPPASLF